MRADATILGGSISALMAGCYLKQQMPDLDVLVLGPAPGDEKRPIVGESLLEPAALFLRALGMEEYLDQQHAVKNCLSFYHKLAPKDPSDRRYSVHAPEKLHHLAYQLDRPRFDHDLRRHAMTMGVRFLEGMAEDIDVGRGAACHTVRAKVGGESLCLKSRWVLDATGRQRQLGRKVTTYTRPKNLQRSSFWFRLADFDPFTDQIKVTMRRSVRYDLWYTTHHFMGHGSWVWAIPLQSDEHERLISIGITYRPDLFPYAMTSIEDFLAHMDREHPVIADMLRSGRVLDQNRYGNYLYWANQVYSPDGWFLIGDAARSVDPLYSVGLSMTVIQLQQVAEIMRCQRGDGIKEKEIAGLERLWMSLTSQHEEDVSDQYACMHDPFQSCMRRYWNASAWFNALLPLWWNNLFHHTQAAPVLARLFEQGRPITRAARKLIERTSRHLGDSLTQADFDRSVDFDWFLNPRFDCSPQDAPVHFGRLFYKRAVFRWKLLKLAGFRGALGQFPFIALEWVLSVVLPFWLRHAVPAAFTGQSASPPDQTH